MNQVPKIESLDLSLADLYKDFYTVPDFQREYVWQPENVERLLQDVLDEFYDEEGRLYESDHEYFIGSIVTCPGPDGTFHLIDGQQRLTTIYLVLCAIRDSLNEAGVDAPVTLRSQIRDSSLDARTGDDVVRYRLSLQYEDSAGVLDSIAGEATAGIAETTASVRNILGAYKTIREFLVANFQGDASGIKRFMATFMLRVKLIRIVTPSLAHALKVFETINERGVGLNAMDLLKNLLFMNASSEDFPKLKDMWKRLTDVLDECREKPLRFLRYYIMSDYVIDWARGLREDEIYEWFVNHKQECGIDADPIGFVDRLVACAIGWRNFLGGSGPTGEPNRYLRNISFLSGAARQHFILLLAGRHLPTPLFAELSRQLENLFFCYIITRESTKTFERNFARWSHELRAVCDMDGLGSFARKYFQPELSQRRAAFEFALRELSAARIQQYRLRYILAKLTQFIEEQAWGSPAHAQLDNYVHGSVNVEHILPQTPTQETRGGFDRPDDWDQYRDKLGNLTLLEQTINAAVSNAAYEKKKPGYRQSAFLLTRSLVETPRVGVNTQLNRAVGELIQFDVWNSDSIDRRQEMLARLGERVWLTDVDTR